MPLVEPNKAIVMRAFGNIFHRSLIPTTTMFFSYVTLAVGKVFLKLMDKSNCVYQATIYSSRSPCVRRLWRFSYWNVFVWPDFVQVFLFVLETGAHSLSCYRRIVELVITAKWYQMLPCGWECWWKNVLNCKDLMSSKWFREKHMDNDKPCRIFIWVLGQFSDSNSSFPHVR